MPSEPDFAAFPLAAKGHAFEDFAPGRVFEHHWGRTITEGDNALFTTIALRFTPLYFNAEYARANGHPGVVVDPLLVLCTAVGLSVEDLSEGGGPFLGVEGVAFEKPVYAGDTLTSKSVVVSRRESDSRPGFGIVTWETEAANQRGERVLRYRRTNLVRKRAAAS